MLSKCIQSAIISRCNGSLNAVQCLNLQFSRKRRPPFVCLSQCSFACKKKTQTEKITNQSHKINIRFGGCVCLFHVQYIIYSHCTLLKKQLHRCFCKSNSSSTLICYYYFCKLTKLLNSSNNFCFIYRSLLFQSYLLLYQSQYNQLIDIFSYSYK